MFSERPENSFFQKISPTDWIEVQNKRLHDTFIEIWSSHDQTGNPVVVLRKSDGIYVKLDENEVSWGWSRNNMSSFLRNGHWQVNEPLASKIEIELGWKQAYKLVWAFNCDFAGNDLGKGKSNSMWECMTRCQSMSGCTHFSWSKKVCYKKFGEISRDKAQIKPNHVCGILDTSKYDLLKL